MTTQPTTPLDIDTALAAEYAAERQIKLRLASLTNFMQAGWGERTQRFGPYTTTEEQVWQRVQNAFDNGDATNVMLGGSPSKFLGKRDGLLAELADVDGRIAELEDLYTGWSRFFLVTSSSGHIHSSRHCHTCRPTTEYGWRPDLSGKTEQEAVDKLGPALCSVCFPSAPVGHQAKKITKAQAAKLAA